MENNSFLADAKVVKLPSKNNEKPLEGSPEAATSDQKNKMQNNPVAKKVEGQNSNEKKEEAKKRPTKEKKFSPQKNKEVKPDLGQDQGRPAAVKGKKPVKRVKRLKKKTIEPVIEKRLQAIIEEKMNENLIFIDKEEYELLIKNADYLSKENENLKKENSLLIEKIKEEEAKNQAALPRGTMPLNMGEQMINSPSAKYTITSKETGEIFEIKKNTKLGQDNTFADILVINPAVSRRHAELVIRENKLYVKDLGSTNHTYINEEKVINNAETEVKNNQVIKFANAEFIVTEIK